MAQIRKRSGSYQIVVSDGYTADGKQVTRRTTWKPPPGMTSRQMEKEVLVQAALFEDRVKKGQYLDGNIKFQPFAEKWFEDYGKTQLRPRTYYRYLEMAKKVYEHIGHIRIDQLRPHHMLDFMAKLAEPGQNHRTGGGLSPKTIKNYLAFVSSILQSAVEWQMIGENPCHRVAPPKVTKKPVECLSEDEAAAFLERLNEEPVEFRAMFTLLLLTGMRRGELLGLEWPDIDMEAGTLSIVRTSQYTPETGNFTDTTKTASSQRVLRLAPEMIALLREFKAWQNERRLAVGAAWSPKWAEHPRLFTQWNGIPMHNNTPYRALQRLLERYGMEHVSLHSLRHTNASVLIENGEDVRTVSGVLGHTQPSTTLNYYAHFFQKANARASQTAANALLRKKRSDKAR